MDKIQQEKKVTISAQVDPVLERDLRIQAALEGISKSEAIRRAITAWTKAYVPSLSGGRVTIREEEEELGW